MGLEEDGKGDGYVGKGDCEELVAIVTLAWDELCEFVWIHV